MVDIKTMKKNFSKIIGNKKISEQLFNRGYYLLMAIKEEDPRFYHLGMAKLLLKKEGIQEAKWHLLEALELSPEQPSIYYNLYKVNVLESDYQEAYLNLFRYSQLIGNQGNVSLPLTLLEELIDLDYKKELFDESDYTIFKSNYYGIVKVDDPNILDALNEVVNCLNNRNYERAEGTLQELNTYIEKSNFPIEVNTITKLVQEIRNKIEEYQIQQLSTNINSLDIVSEKNFEQLLKKLIENGMMTQKVLMLKIEEWIESDLEKAKIALKYLTWSKASPEYSYIINRISEKEEYLNYSAEKREKYDTLKDNGRRALNEKQYQEAIYYFGLGIQETNNNIFNYYIGKTLYKARKYQEAKPYLLEYIKKGASKTTKALLYLEKISKFSGKTKKGTNYIKLMERLQETFPSDFKYFNPYRASKAGKPDVDFDIIKFKASKKLRLKADTFQQATEELSLENYYEYTFAQKLQIIINLYRKGYGKPADKLLEELSATTKEEKKQRQQVLKNKKLYRNQKS